MVVYGLQEVFSCVGTVWTTLTGERTSARRLLPRIVGRSTEPLRTVFGATLAADHTFDEEHRSDIVIVGDLFLNDDLGPVGRWKRETEWLHSQYERGAIVCSVCTGSMMLAEAGLLDDHEATTHWSARELFADCYPRVLLRPERVLVPAGSEHRIVTSGGSMSWTDLALYLIARFCGEHEARRIAKVFLLGDRSDGQLPFAAMARPRQHDDGIVADCQLWIAEHYAVKNPVSQMIARSGLAERTFKRRFRKTTGYPPLGYVQSLRIEEAKHMLETTDGAIDDIALEVGYQEPASFRRLFKKLTGISPKQYRMRFQSVTIRPSTEPA